MKLRATVDVEILNSLCDGIDNETILEIVKLSIEERINSLNEKGVHTFVSGVEIVK